MPKGYNQDRNPPSAYVDEGGWVNARNRRIILNNSRGSMKISPEEARALAAELVAAAEKVERETATQGAA